MKIVEGEARSCLVYIRLHGFSYVGSLIMSMTTMVIRRRLVYVLAMTCDLPKSILFFVSVEFSAAANSWISSLTCSDGYMSTHLTDLRHVI